MFLAVATPVRGHASAGELMKRAELYAVESGRTDALLETFSFEELHLNYSCRRTFLI
jgi:hypothetical protein